MHAADFILKEMKSSDGRLYHRYARGERAIFGFLDDYAYLVFGLVELYEACFKEEYLQACMDLTKKMIEEFWDEQAGGFFLSNKLADKEGSEGVPRVKQAFDGALLRGTRVALLNLLRLARLSGDSSLRSIAQKHSRLFRKRLKFSL